MKFSNKVLLPLSLATMIMIGGCGNPNFDEIDTDIETSVTELGDYYGIEYIFEVTDPKGNYDKIGYFIAFEDEKLKALFPEDVGVSSQPNEAEVQYQEVHQKKPVIFTKLVTIPKDTYGSLSEAKAAAEKIKYKITDSQYIQTYSK